MPAGQIDTPPEILSNKFAEAWVCRVYLVKPSLLRCRPRARSGRSAGAQRPIRRRAAADPPDMRWLTRCGERHRNCQIGPSGG
jgi:hypothetical protein